MEKGQPLAARCSEFDYAVQNLRQAASIPTIPVIAVRYMSFDDVFDLSNLSDLLKETFITD